MNSLIPYPHYWFIAFFAALCIGISKAGFSGISMVSVFLFTDLFGAKNSTGIVLPLLIAADISAYAVVKKHGTWREALLLMPPAMIGIAAAYFILGKIDNHQARVCIGICILLMVAVQGVKLKYKAVFDTLAHSKTFGFSAGVIGGLATMLANAAGPVIQLFLLSRNYPKHELIGIGARYFLLVNLIKTPLSMHLGLITGHSILFNLMLVPAVWLGIWWGRKMIHRVPQIAFEWLVISFSLIAGLRLCFF